MRRKNMRLQQRTRVDVNENDILPAKYTMAVTHEKCRRTYLAQQKKNVKKLTELHSLLRESRKVC